MRIAIEGCGHGTLHAIYASIRKACDLKGWSGVDLLIICGDFQAVRNSCDLNCMSVPQKYRAIGDFHEYYSGARTAPYLTIFVGGNHEASPHLQELYYGGWVAPKIYYLGATNVIRYGDLRIAGMSGIWKGYNYNKPHFERLPYTADEMKSVYHIREIDVRKLLLMTSQVDIGISHDWPRGIEWKGDYKALFKQKDLFEADAKAGKLGSLAAKFVMDRLRPPSWFAAHLHCKFAAIVDYGKEVIDASKEELVLNSNGETRIEHFSHTDGISINSGNDVSRMAMTIQQPAAQVRNTDEIELDLDDDDTAEDYAHNATNAFTSNTADSLISQDVATNSESSIPNSIRSQLPASFTRPSPSNQQVNPAFLPPPAAISNKTTRFLALDKCLPLRKFLQILDVTPLSTSTPVASLQLAYDPEWLAILRVFAQHDPHEQSPPNLGEALYQPLVAKEREWVEQNIVKAGKLQVPEKFEITAPVYDGKDTRSIGKEQATEYNNPQTSAFCEMLGIPNYFNASKEDQIKRRARKKALIEAERRASSGAGGGRSRGGPRGGDRGPMGGNRGRGGYRRGH